jgi:hypothetical protein
MDWEAAFGTGGALLVSTCTLNSHEKQLFSWHNRLWVSKPDIPRNPHDLSDTSRLLTSRYNNRSRCRRDFRTALVVVVKTFGRFETETLDEFRYEELFPFSWFHSCPVISLSVLPAESVQHFVVGLFEMIIE